MVNMWFNKVLRENEKCVFDFLLKKLKEILGHPKLIAQRMSGKLENQAVQTGRNKKGQWK